MEELHRRAKRKLQTPAKKTKKQAPLAAAIDALASLRDFVEELPAETMHLPAGTGVAAEEQVFLLDLTQQEAPETHQPCRSGRGRDCIGQGGGEAVADTARFQRRPTGVGRRPHRLRLIAGFKPRLPIGAGPPHERHTRAHLLQRMNSCGRLRPELSVPLREREQLRAGARAARSDCSDSSWLSGKPSRESRSAFAEAHARAAMRDGLATDGLRATDVMAVLGAHPYKRSSGLARGLSDRLRPKQQ